MLLKVMLANNIADVNCVHSLKDCKEIMLKIEPDIIFIDNNLPDGKGISYIKELKLAAPTARIVMISAMAGLKAQAIEFGADIFIEKPLTQYNIQKVLGAN